MKNYLKRQKEIRLRKWCVEQMINSGGALTSCDIYEWVADKPAKQSQVNVEVVEIKNRGITQ